MSSKFLWRNVLELLFNQLFAFDWHKHIEGGLRGYPVDKLAGVMFIVGQNEWLLLCWI